MPVPRVSVVTSVHNGERYLRESLESVLSHGGVDLEFIVVDDGSTDSTPAILADSSTRDSRLRILTQENRGLTVALIRGCEKARGEFIARHDLDDLSLPGRFAQQVKTLDRDKDLAFVSCWSRVIGPRGELLYEQSPPTQPSARLTRSNGPLGHGSVMMRRDAYEKAGGYREQFRFAQDWDLWWRLAEIGGFLIIPEFLYSHRFEESGTTARHRSTQERLGDLAEACAGARERGEPEKPFLDQAERVSRGVRSGPKGSRAAAEYFIGRSLVRRRDPAARGYLWRCLRSEPWRLKAWISLAQTAFHRRPAS